MAPIVARSIASKDRQKPAATVDRANWRRIVFLLVVALAAGSADGQQVRAKCPSSSTDFRVLSQEAERLMETAQLNVAIACAEGVVRVKEDSPLGYELVAKVCTSGGDLACCSQFCARAWELRGGSSDVSADLHGSQVQCRSGEDLAALLLCGNCYASSETWQLALQRYRAATRCAAAVSPGSDSPVGRGAPVGIAPLAPALANAYNNMGNVLRLLAPDQVEDAVEAYLGAAEWMPQLDDAWFNAGSLVMEQGSNMSRAAELLAHAVTAAPLNVENWRGLASVLSARSRAKSGTPSAAAAGDLRAGDDARPTDVERARRLLVRLGQLQRTHAAPSPPPTRDLAGLAGELLRGTRGQSSRRAEGLSLVRRVILGLSHGSGDREGAVGTIAQIGKDFIRHGQVQLGRSIVLAMTRLLLSAMSPGEKWTLGAALASNEMREYDAAEQALSEAVEGGQLGALPSLIAASQTNCRWDAVRQSMQKFQSARNTAKLQAGLGAYEALYLAVELPVLRAAAEDAAAPLNDRALSRSNPLYYSPFHIRGGLEAAEAGDQPGWTSSWIIGEWGRGAGGLGGARRVVVAYMSSDIKLSHPIGQLLVPVLEGHTSGRVSPVCIDTHELGLVRSKDAWQRQVRSACTGGYLHLHGHSAAQAAELINQQGVHVLVNLNGWAGEDRLDVLTYRPAPLQLNALGYAGTSCCSFIDVLLSDPVSAPPEFRAHYSEALLLLPPSHHVLPHRMLYGHTQGAPPYPREALGLPPEEQGDVESGGGAAVLACFNRVKKIDAKIWDTWLQTLASVPSAVLWLVRLALSPATERRLLESARSAGLSGARIIFTDTLASSEHIAAKRHADVFLDTPVYNAHVTAGDALWAGVVMVVLPLESMAARISASFAAALHGAVFVARDHAEYRDIAAALARRPLLRARLRRHLLHERNLAPLFNVALWARNFERAICMALEAGATVSPLGALENSLAGGKEGLSRKGVTRGMDVLVAIGQAQQQQRAAGGGAGVESMWGGYGAHGL